MLPGATESAWTLVDWLQLIERELLLFALFSFVIGTIDELAIDVIWMAMRLTGRARTPQLAADVGDTLPAISASEALHGRAAIFIPAWNEAEVIGTTIAHMLRIWQQGDYRIYVGCYRNDAATVAAAMGGSGRDARVRLVIHDRAGPTTKADCLNRLYRALGDDEARGDQRFRAVVLQDAEDMVHPLGLGAIDAALGSADFVQLPVLPDFPAGPHWVSGHYCDEFVELHAKALVVRGALGAALPAAGVGCGFERAMLEQVGAIRRRQGEAGPFSADCLTEDYELGMLITRCGGRSRFVRLRDAAGGLIGTRSYFPASLPDAVRQKTRWIHGISLQGWDRLGWAGRPVDVWMALRDRRGPLIALVLFVAYALVVIEGLLLVAQGLGYKLHPLLSPGLRILMAVSIAGFVWRAAMRFVFTTREYGIAEGVCAVLRIPVANVITIMAGRRAFMAYCRSLRGLAVSWEKTSHHGHPALAGGGDLGFTGGRSS